MRVGGRVFPVRVTFLFLLPNEKEFFAEATEAYFYRNDFYPFVAAELEIYDPLTFSVLEQIWGKLR